ncbi:MAG: TerC family protein [Planctomycetota bacterium]|nr:MAG: TerC family protein [Planctomycetota bacterium]RLS92408.1 MAG: TerC family protein [Planctomycetota bacterium]
MVEALLSIFAPENILAFFTLTALEIVLGVDNVVFIAVLAARLPPEKQRAARQLGLIGAMFMRIGLLACINWVRSLTGEVFSGVVFGHQFDLSWRDLVLLVGGLVLLFKATREIHHVSNVTHLDAKPKAISFTSVIVQIMLMDLVFSLDSVITAVGMVEHLPTMILAVIASVGVMMFAAEPIGRFVEARRSLKVLALSFLLLIAVMLIAEGLGTHVSKGYIYFAMAFALGVEMVNFRADTKAARAAQAALERKEALEPRSS